MKKDVFLLFDTACIYEIVCLNYFLKFTGSDSLRMDSKISLYIIKPPE